MRRGTAGVGHGRRGAGTDEVDEAGVALGLGEEEVGAGVLGSGKEHDPDERRVLRDLEERASVHVGFQRDRRGMEEKARWGQGRDRRSRSLRSTEKTERNATDSGETTAGER